MQRPRNIDLACWIAWGVLGVGCALYLWWVDAWWKVLA